LAFSTSSSAAALDTNSRTPSHLLSELPIKGSTLLFGLNFKYTQVVKKGFINRIKGNKQTLDLDLSCLLFDERLHLVDTVWFKQLRDNSSAIRHQGDSLNGKDRGSAAELDRNVDMETIELRLPRLPDEVHHVALLLSSYYGYPLNQVERGNIYISDDEGNEIYTTDLTLLSGDSAALCVAVLSRELGEWRYTQQELPLTECAMPKMTEQVRRELARIYG
jgi:stress response protein SCP2